MFGGHGINRKKEELGGTKVSLLQYIFLFHKCSLACVNYGMGIHITCHYARKMGFCSIVHYFLLFKHILVLISIYI